MYENRAFVEAVRAGSMSPCCKSNRGVSIWNPHTGVIHSWGWNAPPDGFSCDGSDRCRAACSKVCVHAEQTALLNCWDLGTKVRGLEMLHVKVVGGQPVVSGPPSCVDCSKLILFSGIAGMWLYEDVAGLPTLIRYDAREFHMLTLQNLNLPTGGR